MHETVSKFLFIITRVGRRIGRIRTAENANGVNGGTAAFYCFGRVNGTASNSCVVITLRSWLAIRKEDNNLFGIAAGTGLAKGRLGQLHAVIRTGGTGRLYVVYNFFQAVEVGAVAQREILHDLGMVVPIPAVSVGVIADPVAFITGKLYDGNLNLLCRVFNFIVLFLGCIQEILCGGLQCVDSLGVVIVFPSAAHGIIHTAGSIQHQHNINGLGFGLGQRGRGRQGRQGDQKIRTIGFADSFALFAQRGSGRELDLIIRDRLVGPDTALRDAAGTLDLFPRVEGIRVDQRNSILRGRCVGGAARG